MSIETLLRDLVREAIADALRDLQEQQEQALDPDSLLGPQQVADLCGCSQSTSRQLLRAELPSIVLPGTGKGQREQRRVRRGDLLKWLDSRTTRP